MSARWRPGEIKYTYSACGPNATQENLADFTCDATRAAFQLSLRGVACLGTV